MTNASILFRLAWRNLWRNHRRTIVMLLAIMVGVWAMIFMTAMMRGMVDNMIESGIRHLPGEVQIHHPDFRDDPNIVNSTAPLDATSVKQLRDSGIDEWAQRLKVPAMLSSEREVRAVELLAVQPKSEADLAFDISQVTQGRWLHDENDNGLVIGAKLAEKLETRLGKRVVLMSQDIHNDIAERGFRIVGVYHSNDVALAEERNIYAGLQTIQTLLKADGQVSEIAIGGDDYRQSDEILEKTQQLKYVKDHSVEVLPWYRIDRYLGSMLQVMDGFVLIWMVVVFLALSFGLVNTLVMAVFERIREIGLMQALGMQPKLIIVQIMIEALLLLLLGLVAGNLLAVATILPFESGIDVSSVAKGMEMMGANSVLYPSLKFNDVLLANGVVIVLGLLASILPARRAAQYNPIVALYKS